MDLSAALGTAPAKRVPAARQAVQAAAQPEEGEGDAELDALTARLAGLRS